MTPSSDDTFPDWIDLDGNPDAPPLVLVAGLGGISRFWGNAKALLLNEFRVLSYDQAGCGRRAVSDGPVTIEELAEDLAAICVRFLGEVPLTVVGHSTGGAIAQVFAAQYPDLVKQLVLSGTWRRADTYMRELFAYRQSLLRRAPELAAGLTMLLSEDPSGFDAGALDPQPMEPEQVGVVQSRIEALLAFDGTNLAQDITARVMVVGARDDRIVPLAHQFDLHDTLKGSDVRILQAGGHFFPRTQPERFTAFLQDWLST